jgi:hypothetical protein
MAPTPTSRLALLKPDAADLYTVTIHNGNMDILNSIGGIQLCTSGTRPGTPYPDQAIKETDTGRIYVWNAAGPAWVEIFDPADYTPPAPVPETRKLVGGKRYDGSSVVLTTGPNSTTEVITGMDTGTLAVEANTAYIVKATIDWDSTVAADRFDFRIRLTDATGAVLSLKNNQLFQTAAVRETTYLEGLHLQGASAGSIIAVATVQRRSGTGTARIYKSTTTRPSIRLERLGATSQMTQV